VCVCVSVCVCVCVCVWVCVCVCVSTRASNFVTSKNEMNENQESVREKE